jgi:hypothetical protein
MTGSSSAMNSNSKNKDDSLSKYPIYECSGSAGLVRSIQTAAQFGDRAYIRNVLEKSMDTDVNAMVQH